MMEHLQNASFYPTTSREQMKCLPVYSSGSGVIPSFLLEESRVPQFYQKAISSCGALNPSQLPNTAHVYNLMVGSGLPRSILGNIWSLVNCTFPGQLTRQEFFACLALIALVQKGQALSTLASASVLPIPNLQVNVPSSAAFLPSTHSIMQPSSFISPTTFHTNPPSSKPSPTAIYTNFDTHLSASHLPTNIRMPILTSVDTNQSLTPNSSCLISPLTLNSFNAPNCTPLNLSDQSINLKNNFFQIENPMFLPSSSKQISNRQSFMPPLSTNSKNDQKLITNFELLNESSKITMNGIDMLCNISFPLLPASNEVKKESLSNQFAASNSNCLLDLNISDLIPAKTTEKSSIELSAFDKVEESSISADELIEKQEDGEKVAVWERCIKEASTLFHSADIVLPPFSHEAITAVSRTEKGAHYLMALKAIYEMVQRIKEGREFKLIGQKNELDEIEAIWSRLKQFIDKPGKTAITRNVNGVCATHCGICLKEIEYDSLLEFAGTVYHKQCANLWINRVNSLLPKLSNN